MSTSGSGTGSGGEGAGSWSTVHRRGPAAALHALELDDPAHREVWVLDPERPALVLGSTQDDRTADPDRLAAAGVDLVRRRSGGGAVLLDPEGRLGGPPTLWVDVILPRHDRRWLDDVGRSTDWLGEAWVRALASLDVAAEVHRGHLDRTPASTLVCFAGFGPGEVVVDGRKVVGISQRRTRAGARFQCVVHLARHPDGPSGAAPGSGGAEQIVDLLREPSGAAERAALIELLRADVGVVAAPPGDLLAALLAALPTD